jgi:hypothetical protein
MSDDTRFAQVEMRANADAEYGYMADLPCVEDRMWLIARVHALKRETQLAEDGRMDMAIANGVLADRVCALEAQAALDGEMLAQTRKAVAVAIVSGTSSQQFSEVMADLITKANNAKEE